MRRASTIWGLRPRLGEFLKRKNLWIRRHPEFYIVLRLRDRDFVRPPRQYQKQQLLAKSLDEFADDLRYVDRLSRRFVAGSKPPSLPDEWKTREAHFESSQLLIGGHQVMQDWERPLMAAMAGAVGETGGDILEVGFGMGISASFIQEQGVRSHTIVEANDAVVARFHEWKDQYPGRTIHLIHGRWQDVVGQFAEYDGVFFDTYLTYDDPHSGSLVPSASVFPVAANVLRKGGIFTYYTGEIDSFSRAHQRRLFEHFSSITLSVVRPLAPPQDCQYWWADSMVVVKAVK